MLETLKKEPYVDFYVHQVEAMPEGGFCFTVDLIYADGDIVTQDKAGFSTIESAFIARDEMVGKLSKKEYVVCDKVKVSDFFSYWLESEMRVRITADSYDNYRNIVHNHIIPFFSSEEIFLSEIKTGDVRRLYNELAAYSESVAKQSKTVMNTALRHARHINLIARNPAKGVGLPKGIMKSKFHQREINTARTLTKEQVDILLEASKASPIRLQVLFAVLMGLRRSEINGLKYSDINYINQTLTIQRQLGNAPNTSKEDFPYGEYSKQPIPPKTESSYRTLPIPALVFGELLKERKRYEANLKRRINDKTNPFLDEDYIVCSSYGKPRSKGFHQQHFKKLLKYAGLPDIRFHDLRATYCTLLIKEGFSPKAVSKLMGHAKEIITLDIYSDNSQLIADGVAELQPFLDEVLPKEEERIKDLTNYVVDVEEYLK